MRTPGRAAGGVATLAALVAPVWLGAPAGCTSNDDPVVTLTQVVPGQAFNDTPVDLTVKGRNLRPAYRIDTRSGDATFDPDGYAVSLIPVPDEDPASGLVTVSATRVTWTVTDLAAGLGELSVELPPHITVGVYDVAVRNPRGDESRLPAAFVSMGRDTMAPDVSIEEPRRNTVIGAGTKISVSADDHFGALESLHFEVTGPEGTVYGQDCPVPANTQRTNCLLSFKAPEKTVSNLDVLRLDAIAVDKNGNRGSAYSPIGLAPVPIIIDFWPDIGPASGSTLVTVTGRGFVPSQPNDPGTQVLIDGRRLDDMVVTPTMISGTTFAHDPGEGIVSVRTGDAYAAAMHKFLFIARPLVRRIVPLIGPIEGGKPVTIQGNGFRKETEIKFGTEPLVAPNYISANRIDGILPASVTGVGAVTVTAYDPIGGTGSKVDAFNYALSDDGGDGAIP
jgi:IPT/TIG domain-containing protein